MEYEYSRGGAHEASKFMIGPFRSYDHMVRIKTTISTKLHLVVDFCVLTSQVMWYMHKQWRLFFIRRFLNLQGATGFAKRN